MMLREAAAHVNIHRLTLACIGRATPSAEPRDVCQLEVLPN